MKKNTQYYNQVKAGKLQNGLICAVLALLIIGSTSSNASALGNNILSSMNISQERIVTNGVLISRPAAIDEKIRDIMIFNNIRTLNDYVRWLKKNIKYRKDKKGDVWADPEDTLSSNGGDCEDFAFFNAAVLKVLGFNPEVLAIIRIGRSHAICVFKENGYYSIIDNNTLIRTKKTTMTSFTPKLMDMYNFATLGSIKLSSRRINVIAHKSQVLASKM
ncbi:MAG: hypothetical protein GY853_04650 [PVC group bacterium]|nr:hypothetical protein [PVC group bacterium]